MVRRKLFHVKSKGHLIFEILELSWFAWNLAGFLFLTAASMPFFVDEWASAFSFVFP